MNARHLILGALAASAGVFAAPSFADNLYIDVAPPPVRVERYEARPGHVWVPGHWEWRHGKHEWIAGRYVNERKGYHWERDRWVMNDENKWIYQHGGWNRDSDRDGTPDRVDRAPNNPYRQ